jgi:serine/threonine protein phosphatase 1
MKNGIWVIGDVHGMYDKLVRLLDKLPKDVHICFVGDLIDRGKDSAKVVQLVINNGYFCVLGNHELMMIKSQIEDGKYNFAWEEFGGTETLESYAKFDDELFKSHIEYFKTLPYFLCFEIEGHKPLVVTHSYVHHVWKNKEHRYSKDDVGDILWRHMHDKKLFDRDRELENGIFNIFGHTTVYGVVTTDTYSVIDTGAYYENNKQLGYLSAVHYPSLEIVQVF